LCASMRKKRGTAILGRQQPGDPFGRIGLLSPGRIRQPRREALLKAGTGRWRSPEPDDIVAVVVEIEVADRRPQPPEKVILVGEMRGLDRCRILVCPEDELCSLFLDRYQVALVGIIGCPDRLLRVVEIDRHGGCTGVYGSFDYPALQAPIYRHDEGIGVERLAGDGDDGKGWMGRREAVRQQRGAPVCRPVLQLQNRRRHGRDEEQADDGQQRGQPKGRGIPGDSTLAARYLGQHATFLPVRTRRPSTIL